MSQTIPTTSETRRTPGISKSLAPHDRSPRSSALALGRDPIRFALDFGTGLNACSECCDRHAWAHRVALFWQDKDDRSATYTIDEFQLRGTKVP